MAITVHIGSESPEKTPKHSGNMATVKRLLFAVILYFTICVTTSAACGGSQIPGLRHSAQVVNLVVGGVIMTSQVVNLEVTVSIPINCDFWSEDDGWKGHCKSPPVTVSGSSFEDAKKNMASELQVHIERILREHVKGSTRRIA